LAAITDFIALAVETANADFASICSIGLVHFRAGAIFKLLTVLVDPEDDFNPINISRRPLKWKIRTKKMID
jgi:DNA polymerase III subunit epsilon